MIKAGDGTGTREGLQQFVLKLEPTTARGPIRELHSVSINSEISHFACAHTGGGISLWSSKGVELRFIPCHQESTFVIKEMELFVLEGNGTMKTYDPL